MKCVECGKEASKLNALGHPVCGAHAKTKTRAPKCPECGLEMSIRKSKYGLFWGCKAFPMCQGTQRI